jgi:hypothetical protein
MDDHRAARPLASPQGDLGKRVALGRVTSVAAIPRAAHRQRLLERRHELRETGEQGEKYQVRALH